MHSSRLRTGWLWLRIGLAHLLPPHSAPLLIFIVVLMLAINMARFSSGWRHDIRPQPTPTSVPSLGLNPSRSTTIPVTEPPTTHPTTGPPETPVVPSRHPTHPAVYAVPTGIPVSPADPSSSAPAPSTPSKSPSPSSTPTPTPTPTPSPSSSSPSSPPPGLTLALNASPSSGNVGPCYRMVVSFTGTIAVDQAATVTYRWEPEPPSVGPQSKTFAAAGRKTVRTSLTVQPKPGEVLDGSMRLIASAPGAKTATVTAGYSLTCTG